MHQVPLASVPEYDADEIDQVLDEGRGSYHGEMLLLDFLGRWILLRGAGVLN